MITPQRVSHARFEALASSSRSQVASCAASVTLRLTWEWPSVDVRWRPPLAVAIVTHLVTRPVAGWCWSHCAGGIILSGP